MWWLSAASSTLVRAPADNDRDHQGADITVISHVRKGISKSYNSPFLTNNIVIKIGMHQVQRRLKTIRLK